MTNLKHTPGKWSIEKCMCGHPACKDYRLSNQGSVGFTLEDARLIASAPELLEALKSILSELNGIDEQELSQAEKNILRKSKQAISKAEGK